MSTKTTFKRIALVAVAALGFGVLSSVSPANAVATSFTLDKTSITVVDDRSGSDTLVAVFAITVTNTETGSAAGLTQDDTITASVVGGPATLANGNAYTLSAWQTDVKFIEIKQSAATRVDPVYSGAIVDTQTGGAGAYDGKIGALNTGHYGMGAATTAAASTTASEGKTRTYYIAATATRATVVNLGVYTLQFDLTNAAGATIQRSTAKFDVVSAAASSGAILSAASTGQWFVGDTPSAANQVVTDKQITATLTNRDGGAVRTGTGAAPTLSAQVADASTVINYQTLTIQDTAAESITAGAATNGVYGINSSSAWTGQKGPLTLTVRYGLASATASIALAAAATAATTGTGSVAATGAVIGSGTATLPLTTKSVTFSYKVTTGSGASLAGQTGYSAYYTLTNGASCSAGDMSVADTTAPVKVLTDANGIATLTVANTYPLTGCTVAVTWIGAATNVTATQTVTWAKSAAASAISNPGGNIQALLKSTNKTTWTIVDQFGAPMAGATVTFGHTGENAPTVAPAAAVTDANGQVSYSVTDALAVAAKTDVVSVATVNAVAPTTSPGSVTITYKTTLDVVASLYSTYTLTGGTATLVPTTVIAGAAGTGIVASALDQKDWSVAQTTSAVSALTGVVALNFTAKTAADVAVSGIPTTVTATGGYILGADGKLGTSRTIYANDTIYVVGAKTGVVTVTATNGTLTKTLQCCSLTLQQMHVFYQQQNQQEQSLLRLLTSRATQLQA